MTSYEFRFLILALIVSVLTSLTAFAGTEDDADVALFLAGSHDSQNLIYSKTSEACQKAVEDGEKYADAEACKKEKRYTAALNARAGNLPSSAKEPTE